ncbi:hypothetical protein [Chitinophaga sp. Cy-1792]|uniref:hypothetical protein n=1 Tax=Chitinophaga sp. Cy-1792 TaxID=2608339 RepID=UPI00141EB664|nr:hypothetical protein [Chitinophaga sp. Cy-1792]NIG56390.1 hypothetical protein [Chitinophaga sp. Cy-1792]
MITFPKNLTRLTWVVVGASAMFLASCSKNNDVTAPQPLNAGANAAVAGGVTAFLTVPDGGSADITSNGATGKIYRDGSIYRVENFHQAYSTGSGQPADGNFYWSFTDNDAANPGTYSIKFSGVATGDISATGTNELRFIDKAFASVTASDWTTATVPDANTIGMNNVLGTGVPPAVLALANGKGWYTYNWSAGHTVTPVSGRTLLWKSGTTVIAFDIQSIYQNQVTGGTFPYYHFRYKTL